ncbi:MAG TPA: hypothetical protein VHA52_00980 [Candidatus Babeliaceae bacterium]|nr:hypothetical protein [Candidatus Babeliaceae bacterium]
MKSNNNRASDQTANTGLPENNPSKAMDSKREVEQSNDAKTDQDFPGYPHYPAKEDIMDQRTGSHQVDVDMENLASARNATGVSQRFSTTKTNPQNPSAQNFSSKKNDEEDLDELNSTNDEIGVPQNVSNEDLNTDLDVPGSELDDAEENIGEEDEENNYYSLGGDRHESQEEDPYSGPQRGNA